MNTALVLSTAAAAATAVLAAAAPASAHCGCSPRYAHHVVRHYPLHRVARRVVVVHDRVYVPGPERVIREPVYLPGPERIVREPVYSPPVVIRERGWRPAPFYPLAPVRYGWSGRVHDHEGWRDHDGRRDRDGWREHARYDGERRFEERERRWR